MTISSAVSRNDYTGNGAADTYAYTFRILAETDLLVTTRDDEGNETTLTLNVDYTVSGVGDAGGGSIVLTAGNLTNGYALTIRRVRPITQSTDIRNQGSFFPETHEDAFDHFVMVDQQQQDEIDRSLRLPETETPSDVNRTLPDADTRASKYLAFDADGAPIAATAVDPGTVTISAYAETILDDADAAAARATLGIDGASGNIATDDLADDAVTAAKIATDAVGSDEIASEAVRGQTANSGGSAREIAAGTVSTPDLRDAAVTTAKIDDEAVTQVEQAYDAYSTAYGGTLAKSVTITTTGGPVLVVAKAWVSADYVDTGAPLFKHYAWASVFIKRGSEPLADSFASFKNNCSDITDLIDIDITLSTFSIDSPSAGEHTYNLYYDGSGTPSVNFPNITAIELKR